MANENGVSGRKVISNFLWRLMERFGAQIVTFVVSIVLARLLDPETYGTIALVTVFTTILQVFVDSGLGNALIQKKDADDLDFSSVFYMNLVVCVTLYAGMFFAAPLIAKFYDSPELTPVVRVMSLTLVVSGVKNVQQAYVSRNMLFKRFFAATLAGTIGAAVLGIYLAWAGYGVWALVAQHLFNLTVDTIILWITVKWRPKWMFSWKRLKGLFSYGWKMLASSLLVTVYNDLTQLIIGKKYTSDTLAFFNRGKQFPYLISDNVNISIDSVLLPVLSKQQDSLDQVKATTRRSIGMSTYCIWPMMIGFAVCGKALISIILTEKWLPCVPYLVVFCIICAIRPISTANLNAMKAIGRSDLYLKLEIVKKAIGFAILLGSMWISPMAMALGLLLSEIVNLVVNTWPNKKLLGYSLPEQLKDILPTVFLSAVMGGAVYGLSFLPLHNYLILAIQIVCGIGIYVTLSKITKNQHFAYMITIIQSLLRKKAKNK